MEIIKEEKEEIKQGNSGIKEQTEKDDDDMGNMDNPYHVL